MHVVEDGGVDDRGMLAIVDLIAMADAYRMGKGGKDRNAMRSQQLRELLRLWRREGRRRGVMRPHGWLLRGRSRTDPISARQLHRFLDSSKAIGSRR